MTEFKFLKDDPEPELPRYSDPGFVFFRVYKNDDGTINEIDVLEYDAGASTFWLNEGIGFDYWIETEFDHNLFVDEGFYVIENIVGHYYRGDGYTTDDNEEWESDPPRLATQEEIDTGTVTIKEKP